MKKNTWNRRIGFLYLNLALDYAIRGDEKKRIEMQEKAAKRFGFNSYQKLSEHFLKENEL